jgi:hypothetical protein
MEFGQVSWLVYVHFSAGKRHGDQGTWRLCKQGARAFVGVELEQIREDFTRK